MTRLERTYRLLMRAYPAHHRDRHEEEMVATLLDVADENQARPRLGEAAALVKTGLGVRLRDSSELQLGIRSAGLVAFGAAVFASTMALGLASQRPSDGAVVPFIAWVVVLALSLIHI